MEDKTTNYNFNKPNPIKNPDEPFDLKKFISDNLDLIDELFKKKADLIGGKLPTSQLTLDNTPTEGSNNPISSDGAKAALDKKQNAEDAFSGDYNDLDNVPKSFPPSAHTHSFNSIDDKPESYPPSEHTHPYIPTSEKNKANGVAGLNKDGKVYEEQLPEMDFYSKDEILSNITCTALGIPTNSVPDDAFMKLALGTYKYVYVITAKTSTGRILAGITIDGITNKSGQPAVTDSNGVVIGFSNSSTVTLTFTSDFIDIHTTTKHVTNTGVLTQVNFIINAIVENTTITIDTSKSIRFSKPVSADIHLVGAGKDGEGSKSSSIYDIGKGGDSGFQYYKTNVSIDTNSYPLIVGASDGANTTFKGLNSKNGTNEETSLFASGQDSSTKLFGTGRVIAGGSGGCGGMDDDTGEGIDGGSPYGGDGGDGRLYNSSNVNGKDATGYGGGGGGAGADLVHFHDGGKGYQGVMFIRWRYA